MLGPCMALCGLAICGLGSGDDGEAALRAGFAQPGADYRALPLEGKGLQSASGEAAQALVAGRWGGLNHAFHGGAYLRAPEGWLKFGASLASLREHGQLAWIYDEAGYPSGRAGGLTLAGHPEWQAQGMFGAVMAAPAGPVAWPLPAGTPYLVVAFPLAANLRDVAGEPLDLTADAKDGVLKATLPATAPGWKLVALVQNRLFAGTHATLTGGQPYLNILDPEAVKRFVEVTYQAYNDHCSAEFGPTIKAIFNDEVSLMSGYLAEQAQPYPAVAWWHGLPDLYRQRTGEDLRRCLPALFTDVGPDTVRLRCSFYALLGQQVADAFFRQLADWCRAHGVASTGHLLWEESLIYHVNFYGTDFPSYLALDWPGIDVLGCNYGRTSGAATEGGPVTPKLASSAAHLLGKPRTMSESFCFVKAPRPIEDLMAHYSWQAVLGINALTTISAQDVYSPADLGRFNDYVGRLNWLLTQGRCAADVALLYPIASVWADFQPTARHVKFLDDNPGAKRVDDAWREASEQTLACQRDFDYLDEPRLQQATVADGRLRFGQQAYRVLVLPGVTTLEQRTVAQLQRFVDSGGTVIGYRAQPVHRADAGPADAFQAALAALWPRVRPATNADELRAALAHAGDPAVTVTPSTADVYCQHRVLPSGDLFYLLNNAKTTFTGEFSFRANGRAEVWDPDTGQAAPAAGGPALHLTLPSRRGLFVLFTKERNR